MLAPAFAAEVPLKVLLKAVEQRYNRAKTLEVLFSQRYTMQGRTRTESGQLWLRKPGRMRWEYSKPEGKLFVSDGKFVYFYSPASNRAEKAKLKESEDLRAPLAFLLGKLDFDREFRSFTATAQGADTLITAQAKSDRLPYSEVEFLVSPGVRHPPFAGSRAGPLGSRILFRRRESEPPGGRRSLSFQTAAGRRIRGSPGRGRPEALTVPEWVVKYADSRGEIRQQTIDADSEQEIRDRYTDQGFLIYTVRPRTPAVPFARALARRGRKINVEKFLIFNQQFVTLVRAGLPILKSLDLLADRLTDPKLGRYIKQVRDEVRNGALLSEAFRQAGVFPAIYVTSVMAGEKSGSLPEVLDRFLTYQKLALAVRKKLLLSLLYPAFLIVLVGALIVFLVTYVVPSFAQLYQSMQAKLPMATQILVAVGTTARNYLLALVGGLAGIVVLFNLWARGESAQAHIDAVKRRTPLLGDIWVKYQVAQLSRVLSTLLIGGIPLVQALETAAESLTSKLLRRALDTARQKVREGESLSNALSGTGIFPGLSIDMIEVGESTGALPAMLGSVAEFYEDDVNTQMTAALSLIEPVIMIFMGTFVAFVLVALYLPIFSLADTLR